MGAHGIDLIYSEIVSAVRDDLKHQVNIINGNNKLYKENVDINIIYNQAYQEKEKVKVIPIFRKEVLQAA